MEQAERNGTETELFYAYCKCTQVHTYKYTVAGLFHYTYVLEYLRGLLSGIGDALRE